jgi:hypothetical protein
MQTDSTVGCAARESWSAFGDALKLHILSFPRGLRKGQDADRFSLEML